MRPLVKLRRLSGQVTFEAALVITLVTAGLVIGMPYVIRSWNASVQSASDGIQDSFDEDFEETGRVGVTNLPCQCTPIMGGPPNTCDIAPCGPLEYRRARRCLPVGCADIQESCTQDPQCCDIWVDDGCGAAAVLNPAKCPDGERSFRRVCGTGVVEYKCEPDPACIFSCLGEDFAGNPADPYAQGWCFPGSYDSGLTANTPVTYVVAGNCPLSPAAGKCVAECLPTFTNAGASCNCPSGPGWSIVP